jgi:hypothetical protein
MRDAAPGMLLEMGVRVTRLIERGKQDEPSHRLADVREVAEQIRTERPKLPIE